MTRVEDEFPPSVACCGSCRKGQELISYYVLSKTQTMLSGLNCTTQTRTYSAIRAALKKMGGMMMAGEAAGPAKAEGTPLREVVRYKDPAILGRFRMAIEDPGFDKVFTQHASL